MKNFQVSLDHSIKRVGESSYSSLSGNRVTVNITARDSIQATNMATSMFGGQQNCQVRSIWQK